MRINEVLVCTVDTEERKVTLSYRNCRYLITLLNLLAPPHHMIQKYLERFMRKICSIHLLVPITATHLCQLYHTLMQGGKDRICLSPELHQELRDWCALMEYMKYWPTQLADIVL